MAHIALGQGPRGVVKVDLDVLLRTRLLIQANSGGGKSWLLRRLAEQLFGHVPIIILDPEGEFATLRERFDFVLVGPGGETPADVRSAPALARKLLELGASAVCDLYELDNDTRHEWVAAFLQALVDAPKALWRNVIVMVDEAHLFAPEKGAGESAATNAMLALATRGRKRGYCCIYATQRLGKLRKDAAAELQNVLVGQTFIDIDRERAAAALGIPRGQLAKFYGQVKTMPPGRFYGFGRAISTDPVLIKVGSVGTTHPEPGESRHASEPPPAPAAIRHLLPQLADLPRVAAAEAKTEQELRRELELIRRQLDEALAKPPQVEVRSTAFIPPRVRDDVTVLDRNMRAAVGQLEHLQGFLDDFARELAAPPGPSGVPRPEPPPRAPTPKVARPPSNGSPDLPRGAREILTTLASRHPTPLARTQIATLVRMPPKGSTLRTYLGKLATAGLIQRIDDDYSITDAGLSTAGPSNKPATPADLVALWRSKLTGKAKDMLELFAAEHGPLVSHVVAERLGLDPAGSTFRTYLGHLRTNGLVRKTTGGFVVADELRL